MDGILRSMEDNMKSIRFTFTMIMIIIAPFSNANDEIKNEFASKKEISSAKLQRQTTPIILIDSIVIKNKNNLFDNVPGTTKVGNFIFEKKSNNLKEALLKTNNQSINYSDSDARFRLVEIKGKNDLITDGSFIVFFNNSLDKEQFNFDYNLIPKYEMPTATSYRSNNFETLQTFLITLKDDKRVKLVELDLIDPYIEVQ